MRATDMRGSSLREREEAITAPSSSSHPIYLGTASSDDETCDEAPSSSIRSTCSNKLRFIRTAAFLLLLGVVGFLAVSTNRTARRVVSSYYPDVSGMRESFPGRESIRRILKSSSSSSSSKGKKSRKKKGSSSETTTKRGSHKTIGGSGGATQEASSVSLEVEDEEEDEGGLLTDTTEEEEEEDVDTIGQSQYPSAEPTFKAEPVTGNDPTSKPTHSPDYIKPTNHPTVTGYTHRPTHDPTTKPTRVPTDEPTATSVTAAPTHKPTKHPSAEVWTRNKPPIPRGFYAY